MLDISTQRAAAPNYEENAALPVITSPILRPIQYLGSKLRSLHPLLSYTKHLFGKDDHVVDCFSGSSVVSQAFANSGARVLAVDSQQFCQHIASAMLGIGRAQGELCVENATKLGQHFSSLNIAGALGTLLSQEKITIGKGPTSELVAFYATLPQVWKSSSKEDWFSSVSGSIGGDRYDFRPLIASHYAGTYFGLRQSLFFDYVRNRISELRASDEIGSWTETALLTALYSAMSNVVCSAGKHFAQPLAIKATGNPEFRIARLYADRSIDCIQAFVEAAYSIDNSAQLNSGERHIAVANPIAAVQSEICELRPSLLYADPPYTAQQYSRFYHILEVTADYKVPELQLVKGKVTSGLYNVNRYKSPFSSKSGAPQAFKSLAHTAKECGASLAISYSASSERSTGNSRMITLTELEKICASYFGKKINVIELGHAYRPFNSDDHNNAHRNDPEILIICET